MPALVKSSEGSSLGTRVELSTRVWPFFSKYLRKRERISAAFMRVWFSKGMWGASSLLEGPAY